MGLEIDCARCGGQLKEPGALFFSPPSIADVCVKKHICVECVQFFDEWLANPNLSLDGAMTARRALANDLVALADGRPVVTALASMVDLKIGRLTLALGAVKPIVAAAEKFRATRPSVTQHEVAELCRTVDEYIALWARELAGDLAETGDIETKSPEGHAMPAGTVFTQWTAKQTWGEIEPYLPRVDEFMSNEDLTAAAQKIRDSAPWERLPALATIFLKRPGTDRHWHELVALTLCSLETNGYDKRASMATEFLAQRKLILAIQETLFPGAVVPPTNEVLLEELRAHVALSRANGG